MKIYYARPINLYNSAQDQRDIELMQRLGFEVLNPNKEKLQERYKTEGMDVFLQAVTDCDALAFRSFPDLSISAGVKKEIDKVIELNKPVIELPIITSNRVLSVEDTREYLRCIGAR
jgi:adenylate cyclase class IV